MTTGSTIVKLSSAVALSLLLGACGSTSNSTTTSTQTNHVDASNGQALIIPESVAYAEDAQVPYAVEEECSTNEDFANFLRSYAREQGFTPVSEDNAPEDALKLNVEIEHVYAPAGGAWSGPKFVTASGSLENGTGTIGDFRVKRTTTGGAFAVFKGTCSFVGRNVKAMAADISRWLNNPSERSRLGEY